MGHVQAHEEEHVVLGTQHAHDLPGVRRKDPGDAFGDHVTILIDVRDIVLPELEVLFDTHFA
jgi:hypothetical protein